MKEIAAVLNTVKAPRPERIKAQKAFLRSRNQIWTRIQHGKIPEAYLSAANKKYVGAPRRTAIRCDFLLASKIALRSKYSKDKISDLAQRDLLFSVLRDREVFPNRTGNKFYCCPRCTAKLHECVSAKVFRYIDNVRWQAEIETPRKAKRASRSS